MAEPAKRTLLEAGFAKGDDDFLQKALANYLRLAGRMEF